LSSMIDDSKPIFVQIAERIEDDILTEVLPEEGQVPSTNQFAVYYQINPATAAKGVNMLVDEGILYKKRGIGMFVSASARSTVLKKRKTQFIQQYIRTMMKEAEKLDISVSELVEMIEQEKGE
jgi:DNA-binding transcriptional regulator YhcF (GntR family)